MKLFEDIVKLFDPVHLDEMGDFKLMNRTEEKYLFHIDQLHDILIRAVDDYQAMDIGKQRVIGYENLYFDTTNHLMYRLHHNQKLNRHKIRIRQYLDSQKFFLEVKFKNNKGNTNKQRIPVGGYHSLSDPVSRNFLSSNSPYSFYQLEAKLYTSFERITLVNPIQEERITLDLNMTLRNNKNSITIPYLVIAEVKHEQRYVTSGFSKLLQEARIFPKRISKYCVGTNLLFPELKHNRFKPKIIYLNKLDITRQYDKLYSAII